MMMYGLIENGKDKRNLFLEDGSLYTYEVKKWRKPTSWKDFKKNDKTAKLLRDQATVYSNVGDKIDNHRKVKLSREQSKIQINEGIVEYDERYDD